MLLIFFSGWNFSFNSFSVGRRFRFFRFFLRHRQQQPQCEIRPEESYYRGWELLVLVLGRERTKQQVSRLVSYEERGIGVAVHLSLILGFACGVALNVSMVHKVNAQTRQQANSIALVNYVKSRKRSRQKLIFLKITEPLHLGG